MIQVKRIDHVAIAVADVGTSAAALGGLFGLPATAREHVAAQGVDVMFLDAGTPSGDGAAIELLCPRADDGPGNEGVRRFLDRRGPGLHHICFEVEDLTRALAALKAAGVPLVDERPRAGARGHQVAFIHPRATGGVLFELCQKHVPAQEEKTT